jgi:hypothetical protein
LLCPSERCRWVVKAEPDTQANAQSPAAYRVPVPHVGRCAEFWTHVPQLVGPVTGLPPYATLRLPRKDPATRYPTHHLQDGIEYPTYLNARVKNRKAAKDGASRSLVKSCAAPRLVLWGA